MTEISDIKFRIVDIVDMKGTIIVQARDDEHDVNVSLNFNSLSFHNMDEDTINHHLASAIMKEIKHKESLSRQQFAPDNFAKLKEAMLNKSELSYGRKRELLKVVGKPILVEENVKPGNK